MYAIRNKGTKQWLYGTDYREYPTKQRTSNNKALTFENLEEAKHQFNNRECNNEYEIIEVELRELKELPKRLLSPMARLAKQKQLEGGETRKLSSGETIIGCDKYS